MFCQVNNLQSIISTGNSPFQIEEFHNKKGPDQRNLKFFALVFRFCNLMGLLFIWQVRWHDCIKYRMKNLAPSSCVNSFIVPASLGCLLPPPPLLSIKLLAPLQGPLQILPLSPQAYLHPWIVPYPYFFPLMTLAGFFHCFFPNTINCAHTSSFFSSLSISGLPFSHPNPKPRLQIWLAYSSLKFPDHSSKTFKQ